jgi:hypothetical protein
MIENQFSSPMACASTPMTNRTALRRFTSTSAEAPSAAKPSMDPAELARWLEDGAGPLGERWLASVRARDASLGNGVEELLQGFFGVLLQLLPLTVGPMRTAAEALWVQVAELFGSLAAQRGLAAGEVIEEFQILREALIRLLWASPPVDEPSGLALREVLRLNRVIDQGVTHASVGHTDALFFALFQGSGVPESLTDDARYEIREQLHGLETEVRTLQRALQGR